MSTLSNLFPDVQTSSSPSKPGLDSSTARDVAITPDPVPLDLPIVTSPSLLEQVAGVEGSNRRGLIWFVLSYFVATVVRDACFKPSSVSLPYCLAPGDPHRSDRNLTACIPSIFGDYLLRNLAPVEREDVRWGYILLVRAYDLALGAYVWKKIDGLAKRDGALFGAILASVSRIGLLVFERSYFLLSTETVTTLFLIDLVSLIAGFSLLPIFLPHSVESRPTSSALMRLERHPELLVDLALAVGLGTFSCAFLGYCVERGGGQEFIKSRVLERSVPSALLADTLTPLEMLQHPTVPIPSIRSFLSPLSMPRHVLHSSILSLLTIPFVSMFPSYSPYKIALFAFFLVAPQTSTMLWDVLPLCFEAAFYVGLFEGVKAAVASLMSSWILEELRTRRERVDSLSFVVVGEDQRGSFVLVAEEVVEEEPLQQERMLTTRQRKGKSADDEVNQ